MMSRARLRWILSIWLMSFLPPPARGTTIVLLANSQGAVVASDSRTVTLDQSVTSDSYEKVFRVSDRTIGALSGCLGWSENGVKIWRFRDEIIKTRGAAAWVDALTHRHKIARALQKRIRAFFHSRRKHYFGEDPLTQHVWTFLAGQGRDGSFLCEMFFQWEIVPGPAEITVRMDDPEIRVVPARSDGTRIRIDVNDDIAWVKDQIAEMLDGTRDPPPGCPGILRFGRLTREGRAARAPLALLSRVASEIVEYTKEFDHGVGGSVQLETLNFGAAQ